MTRHLPLAAAAVLLCCIGGTALLRDDAARPVPVVEVVRGPFRQQVVAEGHLEAVTSTPVTVPTTAQRPLTIAWLAEDGTRVASGELVVRFDPSEFERELETGRARLETTAARIEKRSARRDADGANLNRTAALADRELAHAEAYQSTDATLFSRVEIAEDLIDTELASARQDHATSSLAVTERRADADLEVLEVERRTAALQVDRARTGLESMDLTAPHEGILVLERSWGGKPPQAGENVYPGRPIASIPDLRRMQAVVFVLEADAGGLAPGQTAMVRLEAHPGEVHRARVERVDPVAQPRRRGSPVQYFRTVLALDRTDTALMKPGQTVQAVIVIADLEDALTIPRQAVGERDGAPVVWRRTARGGLEETAVELGPMAAGRAVVLRGLEPDDAIALRDPTLPASHVATGSPPPERTP